MDGCGGFFSELENRGPLMKLLGRAEMFIKFILKSIGHNSGFNSVYDSDWRKVNYDMSKSRCSLLWLMPWFSSEYLNCNIQRHGIQLLWANLCVIWTLRNRSHEVVSNLEREESHQPAVCPTGQENLPRDPHTDQINNVCPMSTVGLLD